MPDVRVALKHHSEIMGVLICLLCTGEAFFVKWRHQWVAAWIGSSNWVPIGSKEWLIIYMSGSYCKPMQSIEGIHLWLPVLHCTMNLVLCVDCQSCWWHVWYSIACVVARWCEVLSIWGQPLAVCKNRFMHTSIIQLKHFALSLLMLMAGDHVMYTWLYSTIFLQAKWWHCGQDVLDLDYHVCSWLVCMEEPHRWVPYQSYYHGTSFLYIIVLLSSCAAGWLLVLLGTFSFSFKVTWMIVACWIFVI